MAGGVALNSVANGKLIEEDIFKNIYIQPASGDAGGAIGAALATHYIYYNKERKVYRNKDQMYGAYLGPEYSNKEVELMWKDFVNTFNLTFVTSHNWDEYETKIYQINTIKEIN